MMVDLVSWDMTRFATERAFRQAGITIDDVTMVELHDCFSPNAMIILDAMGFVPRGKIHELVREGGITYGGRVVVNPSGGLNSRGHPLGATGLAQCCELIWQLRGWANNRLVEDSTCAVQHNLGLGGAVVATVYRRADGLPCKAVPDSIVANKTGLGYNPATKLQGYTAMQAESVRSKRMRHDGAFYKPPKEELSWI